jgi:hypothetical protein
MMKKEMFLFDIQEDVKKLEDGNEETYEYEVVGESHYDVGSIVNNEDVRCTPVECVLCFEDDNQFDKNAVSVGVLSSYSAKEVSAKQVGHLSREDAKYFRNAVKKRERKANAVLTNGYITGHDGMYGVTIILSFDLLD